MSKSKLGDWSVAQAEELYAVNLWGKDYFDVSKDGDVRALLDDGESVLPVSLKEMVAGLEDRGFELPILLRFPDFLKRRIDILNNTFNQAIKEISYKGNYRGVYPIKVNQQDHVVDAITQFGREHHFGLEAGSKAELIAALAHMHDGEAYIVCNGYKDEEFIDLALYANKLGLQCVIVIEMPEELPLILERAEVLGIEPLIGVRIKLSSKSAGHWNDSGGDRSVFGLSAIQLVDVLDRLKAAGKLHWLKLLHYHQGSQIPNIRAIREAASEAIRMYVSLVREGAPMGIIDIGGGLAVDYDGSQTNFQGSCNYSVREYCLDVLESFVAVLDKEKIEHPAIISESGRATVAHSSVLLFNVFEVTHFEPREVPPALGEDSPEMLRNLFEVYQTFTPKRIQEAYNDAMYYRREIQQLFKQGIISLRDRARGDHVYWSIISEVVKEVKRMGRSAPPDLADVEGSLVDIYHVNFSVFQSLPDSWAIDQLFPILPIHRLNEEPTETGIMSDITCDCDGKLDKFIDYHGLKKSLPLHALNDRDDYILGAFLVGAYQETLGDLHNLLGDTNVASITVEEGEIVYEKEIEGDTVADVLSYVEYDTKDMVQRFRDLAERAVRQKRITANERRTILKAYDEGMRGYTYFRD